MRKSGIILVLLLAASSLEVIIPQVTRAQPAYGLKWIEKAPIPPAVGPTGQASVIAGNDGRIYLFGGFSGGSPTTTAEAYNPSDNSWATLAPLPVAARGAAVAKDSSGIIYVISGCCYLPNVQAYNPTSNTWTAKAPIPTGVWMASATTGKDGKIYVFGGEAGSGLTQIYNPGSNTWASGASIPTGRQQLGAVTAPSGYIYVMGGLNATSVATVERYDPTSNTWTSRTSMPVPKNSFGATLGPDGLIYVFGGSNTYSNDQSPYFDSVEVYNPSYDAWFAANTLPSPKRESSATTATNGRMYVLGGANGTYLTTNEEATVFQPENGLTAAIDSMTPNPAAQGQSVTLTGHGVDYFGSIIAYKWRSSISGVISTSATFSTTSLPAGTHNIYFSVEDSSGIWSPEVSATLQISIPIISLSVTSQADVGGTISIAGALNPPIGGTITLTFTRPDGTNINRTATSNSVGYFNATFSPDAGGTWKVRASWTPASGGSTAQSLTQTFIAQTPPSFLSSTLPWLILVAVVVGFGVAVFLTKSKEPKVG